MLLAECVGYCLKSCEGLCGALMCWEIVYWSTPTA